jgi:hypothetical protein
MYKIPTQRSLFSPCEGGQRQQVITDADHASSKEGHVALQNILQVQTAE